jgi:hypothetical protein
MTFSKECHTELHLPSVQLIPRLQVSMLHFNHQLAVHNSTIYNLANDDVVCYVWHEDKVKSNMFTYCVMNYMENYGDFARGDVILYMDGCASQNTNTTLSNAIRYFSITQKYLEEM